MTGNSSSFGQFPHSTPSSGTGDPEPFLPWQNPHNVITFETFSLVEKAIFCYFNPAIFCIGVPANVLNCIVFIRQGLQDRMNLCLFSLSLVDLMFVSLFTLSGSHCWVRLVWPDIYGWWKWSTQKYLLGLYRGFLLCSGCLTMIISVERCVCVFLPLKAASLMKTRTMAVLIAGTILIIHLLCVVFPLKVDFRLVTNVYTNSSDYQLVPSKTYLQNPMVFDVLQNGALMNGVPVFSVVVVAVSTVLTIVQLKRMMAWRENVSMANNASTNQQIALVKMLVIICCIFITTSLPFVALSITTLTEPEFFLNRRYTNIFLATHALHLGLAMINCSLNFFVYVLRSSRFRHELFGVTGLRSSFGRMLNSQSSNTGLVTDSSNTVRKE